MSTHGTLLNGRVAVVTGGMHGIGRGIAHELAEAGASVFVTGRSAPVCVDTDRRVTALRCDHRRDDEVAAAFAHICDAAETIDILANGVWGGYDDMIEDGVFTWPKPFWDQPLWRWGSRRTIVLGQRELFGVGGYLAPR